MSDPVAMNQKTGLLHLPGELRNRIYRLVLLQSRGAADPKGERIVIGPTGVPEPSVLLTCKQVRREAVEIYYAENSFAVLSDDYGPSLILKFTRRLALVNEALPMSSDAIKGRSRNTRVPPQPKWSNLSRWLHAAHESFLLTLCHPSEAPSNYTTEERIVGAMFHLVNRLHDNSWEFWERDT